MSKTADRLRALDDGFMLDHWWYVALADTLEHTRALMARCSKSSPMRQVRYAADKGIAMIDKLAAGLPAAEGEEP